MSGSNNNIKEILQSLLVNRSDRLLVQLFRYVFVGGFAFLVDFSLLFLLTEYCGFHYLVSATVSFIAGLFVNYVISIRWVFRSRESRDKRIEFLYFALIGLIGLGLNNLLIWAFTDKLRIYYLVSKVITTVIVFFWNFLARKFLLFHKRPTRQMERFR